MAKQKKPASKKSGPRKQAKPRQLERPQYKSFRLSKRLKHPSPKLPSAYSLFKQSLKNIWAHKKLFGAILLIYLLLLVIFVRGFGLTDDLGIAKESIQELISGSAGKLAASLTVFGILVGSTSPASEMAATYQSILSILFSLVMIWALRQTLAGEKISVKDTFYKSMYPLVPFLLVLLYIGLQLLPISAAAFLYNVTIASGLAVTVLEQVLWLLLVGLLLMWSVYMVTASVFALYIVTLPDMTPLRALRSTKSLVQFRRWTIMRKVLFLPFVFLILALVIVLPVILLVTPVAEVVFLLLIAAMVPIGHSYGYTLYRELLQ